MELDTPVRVAMNALEYVDDSTHAHVESCFLPHLSFRRINY